MNATVEQVPPTSKFTAQTESLCEAILSTALTTTLELRSRNEQAETKVRNEERMLSSISGERVCVYLHPLAQLQAEGWRTRNSDWQRKYVHQLWLQGRYRTSSNKLDLFADCQRRVLSWRAITQSCLEHTNVSSSQCFWIVHFEKFEMCEVKQRATVQDSCLFDHNWKNDMSVYPRNNEEGDSTLNDSSIWGAHPAAWRGYLSSSRRNKAAYYFWFLKNERELVFSHES